MRVEMFRKILLRLFCIIVLSSPLWFGILFDSGNNSKFWIFNTSISVSEWLSFWPAYISIIVSAYLAYYAIKLTETIEKTSMTEKVERNKSLFAINNITSKINISSRESLNK